MILHHPRLADVNVDVDPKSVKSWTDQGWTKGETKAVKQQQAEADADA